MPRPTNQAVADRIIRLTQLPHTERVQHQLGRRFTLTVFADASWNLHTVCDLTPSLPRYALRSSGWTADTVYDTGREPHRLLTGYGAASPDLTPSLPRNALRSSGWTAENIRHCEIAVLVYRGLGGQLALRVPRRSQRTPAQSRAARAPSRPGNVARVLDTVEPWVYAPDLLVDDGGIALPGQAPPVVRHSDGNHLPLYAQPMLPGEPPRPTRDDFDQHYSTNTGSGCPDCTRVALWLRWERNHVPF